MKKLVYFLLFLYILFILYYIHPLFLSNEVIAGWDTITHISTLDKYPEEILKGNFIYNDPLWFNGYTAYQYYPPLFFIIISLLYLLTFNLFSIVFILKVFLVILIFLFILSLYFLFKKTFNFNKETSIILSVLTSFFWLFSNVFLDFFGIGISHIFYLGEFTNFAGIVLGIFLITYADYYYKLKKRNFKHHLYFIFLLSASLLTHVFAFLFFASFLIFIFIKYSFISKKIFFKNLYSSLIVVFSTLALSFFWMFPILKYFSYSSSVNATFIYTFKDWVLIFLNLNYVFLFYLLFFFFGVYFLFKNKKYEYFYIFLFFLLISVGLFNVPLKIHQYRFFAYVFLFYFIFISIGIIYFYEIIKKIKFKSIKNYYKFIFALIILKIIVFSIIFSLNGISGLKNEYLFTLDKYPSFNDSDFLINYLKDKEPRMVLAEQEIGLESCISSPHYFEYIFTKNNIPSLLGLYTEATQTSLIYPYLNTFSENYRWLVSGYSSENVFNSFDSFIDRLKFYNVDYILACSNKFQAYLNDCLDCKLILSYYLCDTEYKLYSIDNSYSKYQVVNKKILFYDSSSDSDWINFSKMWFESSITYNYPLIRLKNQDLIHKFEKDFVSGIILSDLKNYNKFNHNYNLLYSSHENRISLKNNLGLKHPDILLPYEKMVDIYVFKEEKDFFSIKIDSDENVGVVIRKSYSPFWSAYDSDGKKVEIYEYAPNFMFIYTSQEVNFVFKIPLFLKMLFFIYILFLVLIIYLSIRKVFKFVKM